MKMKQSLALAIVALGMSLSTATVLAQNNNNSGQNGGRSNRGGFGNFDPQQIQQRIMEHYKEVLEVKDDAEWSALQPLVQKVTDLRRESFSGMGRGMFGSRRGGDQGNSDQGSSRRSSSSSFFGTPSPEADALQKAIDAKASKAEIKAALEKYAASRKAKQAELEKAQNNLRQVLTARQEAIATLNGLL
jgi:Spy/CpxP family protein refolding chaperone